MQETWKFSLNPQDQPKNPEILIEEVLDTNERDLGIFLSYYFKKEGAVAEKVKLKGEIEFINDLKGKLMLEFDLVHFNACLNIHEQKRDEIPIQFEFDPLFQNLTLIGPYWPEREMDEI
ncbi:hypothetical protein [Aquiflexum gelatinilyticum]|uniref:hypothetical protein n=1 Tax=Aquiflexum gelatinilyticum TaxID=2961943 RepID=UPI002167FF1E|nr:hypothetical protein [Aquiflexum gelatinilyticum]MCS4436907.1 hypothetical protein [Aquiflexum gelatinilyticum]